MSDECRAGRPDCVLLDVNLPLRDDRRIGAGADRLETVRGYGYRFGGGNPV
jgi:DNA-binding response OmpR family regulator